MRELEKITEVEGHRIRTREFFENGVKRRVHDVERIKPAAAPAVPPAERAAAAQSSRRAPRE